MGGIGKGLWPTLGGILLLLFLLSKVAISCDSSDSNLQGGDTWQYTPPAPEPTSTPLPTPEPIIDADLSGMLNSIESNPVAAAARYEGKLVKISGQITEIGATRCRLMLRG